MSNTLVVDGPETTCPACGADLRLVTSTWRARPNTTFLVGIGLGLIPFVAAVVTVLLMWGGSGVR
jgi:hypothetical protein